MDIWNKKLLRAAERGDNSSVQVCLANGADVNCKDGRGETPLHFAAQYGHTSTVAVIISHGCDINSKDDDGSTPLHFTAKSGHTETVAMIISHGCVINSKDDNGDTPLHEAAFRGHTDTVATIILHGADSEKKNNDGFTPYDVAKNEAIKKLLKGSRDKTNIGLPLELFQMGKESASVFTDLLTEDSYELFELRSMLQGEQGTGKSTIARFLVGKGATKSRKSTDGIELYTGLSFFDDETGDWIGGKQGFGLEDITVSRSIKGFKKERPSIKELKKETKIDTTQQKDTEYVPYDEMYKEKCETQSVAQLSREEAEKYEEIRHEHAPQRTDDITSSTDEFTPPLTGEHIAILDNPNTIAETENTIHPDDIEFYGTVKKPGRIGKLRSFFGVHKQYALEDITVIRSNNDLKNEVPTLQDMLEETKINMTEQKNKEYVPDIIIAKEMCEIQSVLQLSTEEAEKYGHRRHEHAQQRADDIMSTGHELTTPSTGEHIAKLDIPNKIDETKSAISQTDHECSATVKKPGRIRKLKSIFGVKKEYTKKDITVRRSILDLKKEGSSLRDMLEETNVGMTEQKNTEFVPDVDIAKERCGIQSVLQLSTVETEIDGQRQEHTPQLTDDIVSTGHELKTPLPGEHIAKLDIPNEIDDTKSAISPTSHECSETIKYPELMGTFKSIFGVKKDHALEATTVSKSIKAFNNEGHSLQELPEETNIDMTDQKNTKYVLDNEISEKYEYQSVAQLSTAVTEKYVQEKQEEIPQCPDDIMSKRQELKPPLTGTHVAKLDNLNKMAEMEREIRPINYGFSETVKKPGRIGKFKSIFGVKKEYSKKDITVRTSILDLKQEGPSLQDMLEETNVGMTERKNTEIVPDVDIAKERCGIQSVLQLSTEEAEKYEQRRQEHAPQHTDDIMSTGHELKSPSTGEHIAKLDNPNKIDGTKSAISSTDHESYKSVKYPETNVGMTQQKNTDNDISKKTCEIQSVVQLSTEETEIYGQRRQEHTPQLTDDILSKSHELNPQLISQHLDTSNKIVETKRTLNSDDHDLSESIRSPKLIEKLKSYFGVKKDVEDIKLSVTKSKFFNKSRDVARKEFHNRKIVPVTIWDFGGQDVFYITHQTFLTYRAVYMLILDGSRTLNEPCKYVQYLPGRGGAKTQRDYVKFWINTIITYCQGEIVGFPKIIVILTHKDKLRETEVERRRTEIFGEIEEMFDGSLKQHLAIEDRIFVNASDRGDPEMNKIKTSLIRQSRIQPTWGQKLPKCFLPLELEIGYLVREGYTLIHIEQMKKINAQQAIRPLTDCELQVFLKFQHSVGKIIYFDEPFLDQNIIISPTFLIDAFKSLITDEQFCKGDKEKENAWHLMNKKGIILKQAIETIWKQKKYAEFYKSMGYLLGVMTRLDILVEPLRYDSHHQRMQAEFYYVASMVHKQDTTGYLQSPTFSQRNIAISFDTCGSIIPPALSFRFIGYCMSIWGVKTCGDDNGDMLFHRSAVFIIDPTLDAHIQCEDERLIIRLVHLKHRTLIMRDMASSIRECLFSALLKISQHYIKTSSEGVKNIRSFDVNLCCSSSTDPCFIAIRDIGDYWICSRHQIEHRKDLISSWFTEKEKDSCESSCPVTEQNFLQQSPTELHLRRLATKYTKNEVRQLVIALKLPYEMWDTLDTSTLIDETIRFTALQRCFEKNPFTFKDLIVAAEKENIQNPHVICKVLRERHIRLDTEPERWDLIVTDEDIDKIAPLVGRRSLDYLVELGLTFQHWEQIEYSQTERDLVKLNRMITEAWRDNCKKNNIKPSLRTIGQACENIGINIQIIEKVLFN